MAGDVASELRISIFTLLLISLPKLRPQGRISNQLNNLSTTLFDTLYGIVLADMNLFDHYNETSNLIELKDFISFILTPSVAAILIAEDMDIPIDQAHDVRDDRNEFGNVMQPDDDGDGGNLEDLHWAMNSRQNAFFAHLPRHRKQRVVFSVQELVHCD